MLFVQLAEQLLRRRILRQHALRCHLGDVRRLEVHLKWLRESVHQPRQLDSSIVQTAGELAELLLRRHDEPVAVGNPSIPSCWTMA